MFYTYLNKAWTMFVKEFSGINLWHLIIAFTVPLFVIIPGIVRLKRKKTTVGQIVLAYFICVYACILCLITIVRRQPGYANFYINPYPSWDDFGRNPTRTIYGMFNRWLFIPWGLLLQLYLRKFGTIKSIIFTLIIGFITSCSIEFFQMYFSVGHFEFTDILNNVIGTFEGLALAWIVIKVGLHPKGNIIK